MRRTVIHHHELVVVIMAAPAATVTTLTTLVHKANFAISRTEFARVAMRTAQIMVYQPTEKMTVI